MVITVLPQGLLAALTDVEVLRFRVRFGWPGIVTRLPADGSALLYALQQGGFLISGAAAVLVGLFVQRRSSGWLRLFSTHGVMWSGVWLSLNMLQFAAGTRGPLNSAFRALWPSNFAPSAVRWSIALLAVGTVCIATYVAFRRLLDSVNSADPSTRNRLKALAMWLVVPTTFVTLILLNQPFRRWSLVRTGLVVGPLLLAVVVGLVALATRHHPAPAFRPGLAGATGVLVALGFSLGLRLVSEDLQSRIHQPDFEHYQSRHWHLYLEANSSWDIEQLGESADRRVERLGAVLGIEKLPNPALEAYFYSSPPDPRRSHRTDDPFSVEASGRRVHHILRPDGRPTDYRGDAIALMNAAWGTTSFGAIANGIARYANGGFHGNSLPDYAARISQDEGPYTLREVLRLEGEYLSPLVTDPLQGAWVETLVVRHGKKVLRALYTETSTPNDFEGNVARALGTSWEDLEREWRDYLLALAAGATRSAQRSPHEPFFHRGVTFSHEFGGRWGYGSAHASKELRRIQDMGANAITLVPYGFTRAPREPTISFRTGETDHRVTRTFEAAKGLGLRTVLKPQLWSGRLFTGDIVFETDADFEQWFRQYRRWMLHYARLAELYQVDLLAIGTELDGVTQNEAAWRSLIADVRRIYSGPITYAAHWGPDFEQLPFWDALDYIGLNMYYPLAAPGEMPRADSPRLKELVERIGKIARKYDKPLLFTEVGFPSSARAAAEPWKEDDAALDLELQERCYEVIFEAFYRQPWFAGLYWWKWPSHGNSVPYDGSYNPLGKPAADVLARWYGQGTPP